MHIQRFKEFKVFPLVFSFDIITLHESGSYRRIVILLQYRQNFTGFLVNIVYVFVYLKFVWKAITALVPTYISECLTEYARVKDHQAQNGFMFQEEKQKKQ